MKSYRSKGNRRLIVACFLTSIFINTRVYAQQTGNSLEITPQGTLSLFSAQSNKLEGKAFGAEVIYHINTTNNPRAWMKAINLQSIDLIANYKNMGNIKRVANPIDGEFGNSYALFAGLTIPLLKVEKVKLNFSPAFGFAYAGETWFTNENPIIGSHLNFASRAALKVVAPLTSNFEVTAGLDILHYSNAGVRVPNNGMNISSYSIGAIHYFKSSQKNASTGEESSKYLNNYKKHTFDLGVNIGRRGVYRSKDGLYKTGFYGGYNYRLNTIIGLSAGVDAVYYHSIYDPARNLETYQSNASSFDRWRVGAAIGPDLWMGKLAVMAKYGYYLYYNSLKPMNTYWTAGMKYNLNHWLALQSKIYIHNTEADYVGFGLMFTQ
ncbi:acyloxyacyl hydrolase [Pedobacter sp. ASV28]|uniref:acyloxyacyl hydrolase n=1 Tax=Pedobacter sp. ASV28 TaxID=2795123 RepID=UPI0018EB9879|nr:acyloxyacyl hydrolase [Pedobacter sp. ASV28]